jgi:hypothetical protein
MAAKKAPTREPESWVRVDRPDEENNKCNGNGSEEK